MTDKLTMPEPGGFISRWIRRQIIEALQDHDRGRFVTVYSERKPDDSDILYSPGAQWYDRKNRKRYALKEIKANWQEISTDES